ncbi:MAG TPA: phage portal protein [Thermobifida alba]|nr:phage portal protein [Thermobifida alba]
MSDMDQVVLSDDEVRLVPQSPAWWLHRLCGRLALDQPRLTLMDRYYRGDHPLPYVPRELKAEFRKMLARSRSNFMRLVVQAAAERLKVQGFRARGSEDADQDAWEWWTETCKMHLDANLAISDSMAMGRSYLSVWKFQNEDEPRAQIEDPRTTITERDPINRHKRAAGLRLWLDDWTGKVRADVWLPDGCYRYIAKADQLHRSSLWPQPWQPAYPIDDVDVRRTDLLLRESDPADLVQWTRQWVELDVLPNPTREIPIVPIVNYPTVLKQPDGESELDDVYLTQDRINEMLFNRALAAWTTAYRQKWATGLEIPVDEHGNPVQPFEAAIDRLWIAEGAEARFGEFGQTDLRGYIDSIEEDVKHIAVQTRTPRHYLVEQGQTPSGDSIKSAESGLVAKVEEKQPIIGDALVEVLRLRDRLAGREPRRMEVIWGDPEFRTLAELTDSMIKQVAAGIIPIRVAQERLGYSPSEIARMAALQAQEALLADVRQQTIDENVREEVAEQTQTPAPPAAALPRG